MKSTLLLLFYTFLFTGSLAAQVDFDLDYTLLECQAPIPNSILTSSTKKSEKDIDEKIEKGIRFRDRKKKTDFIIESNYAIDQLLKSHLLLFNTPLNKLAEDILKNLLKEEPDLYGGIDLYIVKSSAVNAFATDRGDVFITMGLLARLKTEAELAFVLAHEVIHYREKHSMETFTEYTEIEKKGRQSYNRTINVLLKKSNYSQSLETIADKKGLEYFAKAGYSFEDVVHVFDVLEQGHTAVYNIPVDKSIFELNHIKIDTSDWLKEVSKKRPLEDDESDDYKSHPDIEKRKDALDENRTYYKVHGRLAYQVSTAEAYANFVKVAQFELLQILLQEREYVRAIYLSYALQTQHPTNAFLKKGFAYALYGLAEYALLDEIGSVLYVNESIQGEWERVNNLFDVLSAKQIAIIAGAYAWEAHLTYPKDNKIRLMARDLIEDIVIYKVEDPLHFFAKAPIDTAILNSTASFSRFGFAHYMSDSTFTNHLERGVVYRKEKKEREEEQETAAYHKKKKKERKNGKSIGAKKIVVVNPTFLVGNIYGYKGVKLDYEVSETKQKELAKHIKETAKNTKLKTIILDINTLTKDSQIEKFKDIHIIEQWTDELLNHPTYIVATNHNKSTEIREKYTSDHFVYTGFVSLKDTRRLRKNIISNGSYYALAYFYPPVMPYALYKTIRRKSKNETYFYLSAVNMKTYSLDLYDSNWINFKAKPALLKTHLYWSFNQLEREKKK